MINMLSLVVFLFLPIQNFAEKIEFNKYEIQNVETINNQLSAPMEFEQDGFWNSRVDRYLFYVMGLETMKKPLKRPKNLEKDLKVENKTDMKWMNLGFYTLMSQSASHTLRSTATEAEFYIKRYGQMKTASGTLAVTSGIFGVLSIILFPFGGGIALTTASVGFGIASAMTGVPAAVLEITNGQINESPDYYARIANNQMKMVQNQGKFLTEFLNQAYNTMDEESSKLTKKEVEDIEKFLYLFEIYNFYEDSELQKPKGKTTNKVLKGYTAIKGIISAVANTHELDAIRRGYKDFKTALEAPNTLNRQKAKNFMYRVFHNEMDIKAWEFALDTDFEHRLVSNDKSSLLADTDDWEVKSRNHILNELSKDPEGNKLRAKTTLSKKATRAKVPKIPFWSKNVAEVILPTAVVNWAKSHAKLVKSALYGVSGVLDSLTIGFGIYDIIIGTKNLQGSGTITDRLNHQANLIDSSLLGVLTVYEDLTNSSTSDLIKDTLNNLDIVTGIELHTCNKYWGGATYGIHARMSSKKSSCQTQDLMEYQLMHRGEWMDYNGFILGNCSHFQLQDEVEISLKNNGTDAICLEDLNIKTNFNPAPKLTCRLPESGVWIAKDYDYADPPEGYAFEHDMKCDVIPGISQLRIVVPDQSNAGTDSPIKMKFMFEGEKSCTTSVLDNKHNDFKINSDNTYQANTLGDCFHLALDEEDLLTDVNGLKYVSLDAINEGSDGLTMTAVEFYINLDEKSQRFKCSLPPFGVRIDYSTANIRCYSVEETFDSRAIFAVEIHPKLNHYMRSFVLMICTGHVKRCCKTSTFYDVYGGYSMMMQGPLLRDCEGFMIEDNQYSIYYQGKWNVHHAYKYLDSVSIYGSRFKLITPMDTCHLNSFEFCNIPNEFRVSSLHFGVCDVTHGGTDSSISLEICSNGKCCNSGILDKNVNDFERGDWMKYGSHELSWECRNFPIFTDDLKVSIINSGSDSLCIDRFQIHSSYEDNLKVLNCYIPMKNEFWVQSEKLLVTCD